ncbi:MAG: DUF3299 domain-containing protein [Planctomycetota bacterium]
MSEFRKCRWLQVLNRDSLMATGVSEESPWAVLPVWQGGRSTVNLEIYSERETIKMHCMKRTLLLPAYLLSVLVIPALHAQDKSDEKTSASRSSANNNVVRGKAEDRTSRSTAKSKGDLTFDDIKFDIEKGGAFARKMLTKDIEELNKREIRIRGFILPASVFKQKGIEEFVLVRDNMECCFGPGAALYDCIIIQMKKGKTATFTTRPVAVRGRFEIQEFKYPDSEEHYAIYKMTAEEVK